MSKIKNCACGCPPAMMWTLDLETGLYYFHMACKRCRRRGKSNRDVNLAVEDWNTRQGDDGWTTK